MSLLLLVEDKEGRKPFEILARKIRRVAVQARFMPQGDMLNISRVAEFLRLHYRSHRNLSYVLICRDSECTPIAETQNRCRQAEEQLNNRLGNRFPPIRYIVVDHSLEGWLASDKDALRHVLGSNARIPRNFNPEEDCRPAEKLDRIFVDNGKDGYEKSRHALQLALACNPKNIAARSDTFRHFQQSVFSG
ncbi:MAG: DUF4276 family protein [Candidatus Tectomicrobia bacterium]|uniref:DUF4276 family protein n=1 Tax=Tectimicrobiota bacterium TaxID=2528274 RepID=A0A933LQM1_UNCTE|nr:DUF4276 family protein [Candidatus Tectomicrobia bacterium]